MSTPMRSLRPLRIFSAVAILVAAGCSLVNTFDEVTPRTDGTYVEADASVLDATGVDNFVPDATGDAGDGGIPSGGAIVVGGRIEDDAGKFVYQLSVLDPANGHEIGKRENMVVAGIQYDGLRDLWYIFESKINDFVPGPTDAVVLHVRQLDPKTGVWTELSQLPVPTPQSYDSIGVTRERLSYVAYKNPDANAGVVEVVTYNTSNPAGVILMNRLDLDITPYGALSTRNVTGVGGNVNFLRMNTGDCDAGNICQLELLPLRVPTNGGNPVFDPPVQLGYTTRFNVPGYAAMAAVGTDLDLVAFPRTSTDAAAPTTLRKWDPRLHTPQPGETQFFVTDSALKRAAVSNCASVAFVVATNGDLRVHAVPIVDNGTPTSATTGHSGQSVYFEPSSKTVLAPFAQGPGFDLSAFRLGGTSAAPTLTKRTSDWDPPKDLVPILLGIREPLPAQCP